MKSTTKKQLYDVLRKEYDFKNLKEGVRGKYAGEFNKNSNIILLEPEVAKAFPTSKDVNEALKLLIKIAANRHES